MNRAGQLARGNLAYRDPALYDDMLAGDDTAGAVARATATAIGIAEQRSVLDLGCGTGRVASQLRATQGWNATGVDLQPGLIAYARDRDPAVRWYTGDITTVRLGETVDVVTSLGNTVAYLHTNQALHAALRTARAHTAAGGLLLIATITTRPPPPAAAAARASDGAAGDRHLSRAGVGRGQLHLRRRAAPAGHHPDLAFPRRAVRARLLRPAGLDPRTTPRTCHARRFRAPGGHHSRHHPRRHPHLNRHDNDATNSRRLEVDTTQRVVVLAGMACYVLMWVVIATPERHTRRLVRWVVAAFTHSVGRDHDTHDTD